MVAITVVLAPKKEGDIPAPPVDAKAAQVVDRYLNAIGGRAVFEAIQDKTVTFETIAVDSEAIRAVARGTAAHIRDTLQQEAVGLVFTPVTFELI